MGFIEGESRGQARLPSGGQAVLFPDVLDDSITAENVVRFIDAFVDGLEMEAMGFDGTASKVRGAAIRKASRLTPRIVGGIFHSARPITREPMELCSCVLIGLTRA